ncbi:hypothetical protein BCV69DRAFT_72240 [Microstroma glucosiphilum]|uniref:Zn(2)-C6 fungal-type domain-containing protein n=1 Tax=Pseudomicrostroma glucosiphilum TaxID=1684307 RepID=A0A316U1P9_9BASI|nr:hypothetical protein BCV69DRAFT_72240 [Pseudomicrostroma glucosiphilum]PWN18411.1 hypothetical protein BCV69DRAFT_72240 [Pseudomicrostroma glucosiphilum]
MAGQRLPSISSSPPMRIAYAGPSTSSSSGTFSSPEAVRQQKRSRPTADETDQLEADEHQQQQHSHLAHQQRSRDASSLLDRPRRTGRACLQCRSRKQKCIVDTVNEEDPHAPCKRCLRNRFDCSFQEADDQGPAPIAPNVGSNDISMLFRQMQRHELRIRALEEQLAGPSALPRRSESSSVPTNVKRREDAELASMDSRSLPNLVEALGEASGIGGKSERPQSASSPRSSSSQSRIGVESLQLDAPIATLRSLGAISQDGWRGRAVESPSSASSSFDPVSRGVLPLDDASQCIATYASSCHLMAPLLDEEMLYSLSILRKRPILFLAICCVGARLWQATPGLDEMTAHPNYDALIELLDESFSKLLLRPTSEHLTLASVQALLITAQWMPMVRTATQRYESRYSEISAGSLLGLVGRYAHSIGLEAASLPPFEGLKGQRRAYKTWHNLLTCDANLMLTSGFPPSTHAASAAETALVLPEHGLSVSDEDVRVAGLLELAAIAQRAIPRAGLLQDISRGVLERFNAELDKWEKVWALRLRERRIRHDQMPFTSLRWYRLAINSSVLRPLLSTPLTSATRNLQYSFVEPLDQSLTAAARILVAYTVSAEQYLPGLKHHIPTSFPEEEKDWKIDDEAVRKLCFAVDSYWVTMTFAVVFLALCYIRGRIDEDCALIFSPSSSPASSISSSSSALYGKPSSSSSNGASPLPGGVRGKKAAPSSLLFKLLTLGHALFSRVCEVAPGPHPAHDLLVVVTDVVRSVNASLPGAGLSAGLKGAGCGAGAVAGAGAGAGAGSGGKMLASGSVAAFPSPKSDRESARALSLSSLISSDRLPGLGAVGASSSTRRSAFAGLPPGSRSGTALGASGLGEGLGEGEDPARRVALHKRLDGSGLQWLGEIWDKMMGVHT